MPPKPLPYPNRIRSLREARGFTQRGLAQAAGLSFTGVQGIESGKRADARRSTLLALARALEVSLDELAGE